MKTEIWVVYNDNNERLQAFQVRREAQAYVDARPDEKLLVYQREGIIEKEVVHLVEMTMPLFEQASAYEEKVRAIALEKLSDEEKRILGVKG